MFLAFSVPAAASTAWGSINNFDAVNDTGSVCHGFEIEIEGIHSRDITYTYDWNHYGAPRITEDNSQFIPRVFVRYESAKNADGSWAAFTSVPSAPILPTDGHQFVNPSVNFGGEHFGVGYLGAPSAVKYSWLKDDGFGNLVFAGAVNIATPTFNYVPPAPLQPAIVQPIIVVPPPAEAPVKEFGPAMWVKVTKTTTHNNAVVELRDLVSDDPNDPNDRNWMNGEPAEVEIEWQLMQTEYAKLDGGANHELDGAEELLENGDEVVTIRYDFFKYSGPLDQETGEALTDSVGPDGIHGIGDYADVVIVGDYIGAQMAGFDVGAKLGLIDHLQDGELNAPYIERRIVVGGTPIITTTLTGVLPNGMFFDDINGILSGTPTEKGTFVFTVHATDLALADVTGTLTLTVVDPNDVPPAHVNIHTSASPIEGGGTTGDGEYLIGDLVSLFASPNPSYTFLAWTDGGSVVSKNASYSVTADVNRELAAVFTVTPVAILLTPESVIAGSAGFTLTVNGQAFVDGSTVNWNGSPRTTTFVSATELSAVIPVEDIAQAGTADVTVTIPTIADPITTGALVFTIANPVPVISSVSPALVVAEGPNFVLTVDGSNFVTGSVVNWNGLPRATTYVSPTQVTAAILAADIAAAGAGTVTVSNGAPGGGDSNTASVTILSKVPVLEITSATAVRLHSKATVTFTVKNTGNTATGLTIGAKNDAKLGSKQMADRAPVSLADIPYTGSASATISFNGIKAGTYTLTVLLTYNGGAATTTAQVVVP
jgi:hypothetical protein